MLDADTLPSGIPGETSSPCESGPRLYLPAILNLSRYKYPFWRGIPSCFIIHYSYLYLCKPVRKVSEVNVYNYGISATTPLAVPSFRTIWISTSVTHEGYKLLFLSVTHEGYKLLFLSVTHEGYKLLFLSVTHEGYKVLFLCVTHEGYKLLVFLYLL